MDQNGFGNGSGAGLYIDFDGTVKFEGATFFLDNEVTEYYQSAGQGAALYSGSAAEEPMIFSGPVTVSGNSGMVGSSTPGESFTLLAMLMEVECPFARVAENLQHERVAMNMSDWRNPDLGVCNGRVRDVSKFAKCFSRAFVEKKNVGALRVQSRPQ